MIFHVASRVGALVDGQLPSGQAERLWAHVHTCGTCRFAVEREGWVKRELARLSWPASTAPAQLEAPTRLGPDPVGARPRRHTGLAALGAGSVGAAMFGLVLLAAPSSLVQDDHVPVTTPVNDLRTGKPDAADNNNARGQVAEPAAWVRMGL